MIRHTFTVQLNTVYSDANRIEIKGLYTIPIRNVCVINLIIYLPFEYVLFWF